ncbi:MAG: rsgA [Proteobacteria bacterium]|nr:rsgA [Pseudomonadota bacterium]
MMESGRIIAAHGRHYLVEAANGAHIRCVPRGKKSELACGDNVQYRHTGPGQGVVEATTPRQSLLYRSNEFRQKLIAANADQLIVVVAVEPAFSVDLISRALLAAESQDIASLIVLNKSDLADRLPAARQQLECLRCIGYRIIELCAIEQAENLRPLLAGHTSVLVGQSGMGKSTLINALIPTAGAVTREISSALDSGKHTTTHAYLYHLDTDSHLIDSPGLQEFGLAHLNRGNLEQCFIEFRPYLGQCRFRDCQHDREPGCALQDACRNGAIAPERLTSFLRLTSSTSKAHH